MLVFVDESGDAGMKKKPGSSEFFIICAILFFENSDAHACDVKIAELRARCFGGSGREFKFNKCCDEHRKAFLKAMADQQFLYLGFVLNKCKLYGPGFQFKEPFYKYTCKLLFENAKKYLTNAIVVIDGCGEREFRRELQRYLKNKINTEGQTISKVKIEASHNNNLLQLADMIVGALARSYRRDKPNRYQYRSIIDGKELYVQTWPKK